MGNWPTQHDHSCWLGRKTSTQTNGCEVRIENSVTRVTVRHHKAWRVMLNIYPEWWNFQFAPNNNYGFFFLHTLPSTIAYRLEYCHILSNLCWNNYIFLSRDVWFCSCLRRWRGNVWRRLDINMTSRCKKWCQNCHPDIMHESFYTPRKKCYVGAVSDVSSLIAEC